MFPEVPSTSFERGEDVYAACFQGICNKVPERVFKEKHIRFSGYLRMLFMFVCGGFPSSNRFGFLGRLREEGWVLAGAAGFQMRFQQELETLRKKNCRLREDRRLAEAPEN